MMKTKQEVDAFIRKSSSKDEDATKRTLRHFPFAKLYFDVGDYEQTIRYVTSYLTIKPKSPEGYKLLGNALAKSHKNQAALDAYKTSLQQDPRQNNLVLKVCELMAQDDVDVKISDSQYFYDLGKSFDPKNSILSHLKKKIISKKSKDVNEISQFLFKELENRPTEVHLRVKLLKHFLDNNMIKEAYMHAYDIEQKNLGIFDNDIAWYEIFAEVLVRYQRDARILTQLNCEFWFLSSSVTEKLAALSLTEHLETTSKTEYITAVFNFDQLLRKVKQSVTSCPDKSLLKEFLNHFEAQLCFHLSVLAFKQAKKDLMTFKEVENLVLPLLFIAYNMPVPDTQTKWFVNLPKNRRLLVTGWYKEAAFRCSQAGNILLGLAIDGRDTLLEKAHQYSTGNWRKSVYEKIFVKFSQKIKTNTSLFVTSSLKPTIRLPELRELGKYNEDAQTMSPSSLYYYIWSALNYRSLSKFSIKTFNGLNYTVSHLNNCAVETLNILDVQSFIFCATLCAQSRIKNADNQDRPQVLPVSLTENLGTPVQVKFMQAAYQMYKHKNISNIQEIKLVLIKGIQVVRCLGNHGLDVELLVTLASTFAEKVDNSANPTEIEGRSARAKLYWKAALPLLKKLENNQSLVYPNNRMFEYKSSKKFSQDEIAMYIGKAELSIGSVGDGRDRLECAAKMVQSIRIELTKSVTEDLQMITNMVKETMREITSSVSDRFQTLIDEVEEIESDLNSSVSDRFHMVTVEEVNNELTSLVSGRYQMVTDLVDKIKIEITSSVRDRFQIITDIIEEIKEELDEESDERVPLLDIVDITTGEEKEEVLYSRTAKLYRYIHTDNKWKERGRGPIKILKNTLNGNIRVVMRRDGVHKICLNHWLTKDINYLLKGDQKLSFHVTDFSDGVLIRARFLLKFESIENAQNFMVAKDWALASPDQEQKIVEAKKTETLTNTEDADSDVEFVSETQVTAEEEIEAIRLGLPPKFLAYKQRPDCNCEQCKKDDEYFNF